jgi:hypothetical protein
VFKYCISVRLATLIVLQLRWLKHIPVTCIDELVLVVVTYVASILFFVCVIIFARPFGRLHFRVPLLNLLKFVVGLAVLLITSRLIRLLTDLWSARVGRITCPQPRLKIIIKLRLILVILLKLKAHEVIANIGDLTAWGLRPCTIYLKNVPVNVARSKEVSLRWKVAYFSDERKIIDWATSWT